MDTYWHKQEAGKPLYPDLVWSRPENKQLAGKLLIIGGNSHEFSAPGNAYSASLRAGVGVAKVLLPESLKKSLGAILEHGEFAPSTKAGSFSKTALASWLDFSAWADGVLLVGDFGRNSETAVVMESFVEKYTGQLVVTKDAVDYFNHQANKLFNREQTTLVLSLAQLQKLCTNLKWTRPITFSMTLLNLVEFLHDLTTSYPCSIITKHNDTIFVAANGQVSTTRLEKDIEVWRVETAAQSSVWQIQNPSKPFEALTTTVIQKV